MPDRTPEVQRTLARMEATVAGLDRAVTRLRQVAVRLRMWIVVLIVALLVACAGGGVALYGIVHASHVRAHDQAAARCRLAQSVADGLDEFGDGLIDQLFAHDPHEAQIRAAVQAAANRAKARLLAGTDCAPETAVPATITPGG